MLRFTRISLVFLLLAGPLWSQETAPPSRATGTLGAALRMGLNDDWENSARQAQFGSPVVARLVDWSRLRAGAGTFAEYQAAPEVFSHWPLLGTIASQGEEYLENASPEVVVAYFETRAPATHDGSRALITAFDALGRAADAEAESVRQWFGVMKLLPRGGCCPALAMGGRAWPKRGSGCTPVKTG
jgi:soluble lytic murein transglycosylase